MRLIDSPLIPKRTSQILAKKLVYTTEDAARFLPRRYLDYRKIKNAYDCDEGEIAAVKGKLFFIALKAGSKKRDFISMRMEQADGTTVGIMVFTNTYLYETYASYKDTQIVVCGKVHLDETYGATICNPDHIYPAKDFHGRIDTVYSSTKGVSDTMLRKVIKTCVDTVSDPVPRSITKKHGLCELQEALYTMHYPESFEAMHKAEKRLIFDDLLYFAQSMHDADAGKKDVIYSMPDRELVRTIIGDLPFELSDGQKKVFWKYMQMAASGNTRINSLLQADVGAGKTIIAVLLSALAASQKEPIQTVVMAPTAALAYQHFQNFESILGKYGIRCVFLTSSLSAKERKAVLKDIKNGSVSVIIGTHSCSTAEYHRLGLVIIDEEQRFGGEIKSAFPRCHTISMTATPIPRSIAEVLFGDEKTIDVMETRKKGEIQTAIQATRRNVFPFLKGELKRGRQAYIVCCQIEDGEESGDDILSLKQAEELYRKELGSEYTFAVINGKMPANELQQITSDFRAGKIHVLIATTVIETGFDCKNASTIVVENAERFGLSSLHQLRGRVGRGTEKGYCILRSHDTKNTRLLNIVQHNDGFILSDLDAKERGYGALNNDNYQSGHSKYMDLVIAYPDVFKICKALVKEYAFTPAFERLMSIYREREENVGFE